MTATELKELRKKTKKYIDLVDEDMVRMLHDLLEAELENQKGDYQLTPEQEAELDRRMELDKKGLMKYSTWEEVEKRIMSKAKNAI